MLLLAVVSGVTWTLLSRNSTRQVVSRFVAEEVAALEREQMARLVDQVEQTWAQTPHVAALDSILDAFLAREERFEAVVIVDDNEEVTTYRGVDQGPFKVLITERGLELNWPQPSGKEFMLKGDVQVGLGEGASFWILPIPALRRAATSLDQPYWGELDRMLWLTGGITLLVALIISALIARGVVAPVQRLVAATQDIAAGRFKSRVSIKGKGEVAQLGTAFNTMATSLERSETLRRQLVSDVAHELRTPLTGLLGQIEALQDGLLPRDDQVLASLHDDVIHLTAIVADLQELALAEARQLDLDRTQLNVAHEVRRACQAFGYPAEGFKGEVPHAKHTIALVYNFAPDLCINADARRLRQVLHNLLENAVRHARARIHIFVQAAAEDVQITIQDDGSGIPDEHVAHIFERFYRGDTSRQRTSGGVGLGLAIAKELVVLQDGRIAVTQTGPTGTTFSVWVPKIKQPITPTPEMVRTWEKRHPERM